MGTEQIPLTTAVLSGFLKIGADGCPTLDHEGQIGVDEEKIMSWVDALAADYDTCGTEKEFQSTRGDIVTVEGGIYGNQIDREAEKEYLLNAFLAAERRSTSRCTNRWPPARERTTSAIPT